MVSYQYISLVDELRDIRLLHLFPGQYDDDLKAAISRVSPEEPPSLTMERLTLRELRTTVPVGWQAFETVEGRYIFEHPEESLTTWEHPVPNVSGYEKVEAALDTDFQPKYEALSYTWGTTENPTILLVESDGSQLAALEIQQNLASALRHLRLQDETRTLWVDAVCINQGSVAERNIQVARMTSIYKNASSVVVWLGPESPESKLAFSALDEIGSQVVLSKCVRRLRTPGAIHRDWFDGPSKIPYPGDTWRAILGVLSRSWFDRVWIVQEIQLANSNATLQCGYESISWERFRSAAWCIFRKQNPPYLPLAQRLAKIKILVISLEDLNFRQLLYGSSTRQCTDPRDHVYGLLGLALPGILREIKPQYASDVGAVYTNAFLAILRQSRRLEALMDCGMRAGQSVFELPSWVPDWSFPIEEQVGVLNSLYSGSGVSSAQATFIHPNILEVAGVMSDTVRLVKGPPPKEKKDMLKAVWDWVPKDIRTQVYPTGESALTAYGMSLSLGMVTDRFPAAVGLIPTLQELETELESFTAAAECPTDESPPSAFRQMLGNLKGRVFVVTEGGYFGLGPPRTEPGDHVCTILGCRDLIVLRPTAAGKYQVVGSCHLHGLSDAEKLLGPPPEPWVFRVKPGQAGGRVHYFHNSVTSEECMGDPRLDSLPSEWESCEPEDSSGEATRVEWFRNKETGDTLNSDPRMLPGALEGRGVDVRKIQLV